MGGNDTSVELFEFMCCCLRLTLMLVRKQIGELEDERKSPRGCTPGFPKVLYSL